VNKRVQSVDDVVDPLQLCIWAITKNLATILLRLQDVVIEISNDAQELHAVRIVRLDELTHTAVIRIKKARVVMRVIQTCGLALDSDLGDDEIRSNLMDNSNYLTSDWNHLVKGDCPEGPTSFVHVLEEGIIDAIEDDRTLL
jgi:hypothetical protein